MNYTEGTHITDTEGVREFLKYVVNDYHLEDFHPDDDFHAYVDLKTKAPVFSEELAVLYNRLLGECFDVCEKSGEDLYDIGWEVLEKYLML